MRHAAYLPIYCGAAAVLLQIKSQDSPHMGAHRRIDVYMRYSL